MAIAWDTDTGEVIVEVQPSCMSLYGCDPPRAFGEGNNITINPTSDGSLSLTIDAQDAIVDFIPAIDMELTINPKASIGSGKQTGTRVGIKGDPYPDVEVVQYRAGESPKFLAKSPHLYPGGAMWNLSSLAPDRNETWDNGQTGSTADDVGFPFNRTTCYIVNPFFCS